MGDSFRRLLRNLRRADDADSLMVGDVIRTAEPMKTDSLSHRAGEYLRVQLSTHGSVAEARDLVASGRWVVENRKDGAQ